MQEKIEKLEQTIKAMAEQMVEMNQRINELEMTKKTEQDELRDLAETFRTFQGDET